MPIYEWYCSHCGHEDETLQSINDPAPVCLKCDYNTNRHKKLEVMKRKISKSSFILRGDGWANDGYSISKKVKNDNKKKG